MSELQKARARLELARVNYHRTITAFREASDECMAACKALDNLEARDREPVNTPEAKP